MVKFFYNKNKVIALKINSNKKKYWEYKNQFNSKAKWHKYQRNFIKEHYLLLLYNMANNSVYKNDMVKISELENYFRQRRSSIKIKIKQ